MTTDRCDTNNNSADTETPLECESPGALLKAAREQAGLTQRQVAERLRLLPDQIESLEQDEFARFNGPLFYKAHLKSYAALLKLDGQQLAERYGQQCPENRSGLAPSSLAAQPIQRPARGHSFQYWGLAVVAVLSVILWVSEGAQVEEAPAVASQVVDSNDQSTLQVLDAEQPRRVLAEPTAEENADVAEFSEQDENPFVLDLPARTVLSENSTQVSDPGSDVLKFGFSADCWVEVKDGNGAVIFASLKRAQETLELSGAGPFKVLLGYAHGVSLDYNGKPVEINVNRSNNSARLVVGNLPVH